MKRFSSQRTLGLLLLLTFSACSVNTLVNTDAQIRCTNTDDCPSGFTCKTEIRLCTPSAATDTQGPLLQAAVPLTGELVELTFDEAFSPQSLSDVIMTTAPPLEIVSITASAEQKILLGTELQKPGQIYGLTLSGLRDGFGNEVDAGDENLSFIGFGTVPDESPPDLFTPAHLEIRTDRDVQFVWASRIGASSYTIDVAEDEDFENHVSDSPKTVSSENTTFSNLKRGQRYFWRVKADVSSQSSTNDPWSHLEVRTFEILGNSLHVYCPADTDCSAESFQSGNTIAPFLRIQSAIDAAQFFEKKSIKIARRGSAQFYDESITLASEIDLRGGYSQDFEEQDLLRPTEIQSLGTVLSVVGIESVTGQTETLIQGLHLEGIDDPAQLDSTALWISDSDGALEIQNCTLIGGIAKIRSTGLLLTKPSASPLGPPRAENLQILSQDAAESFAVVLEGGAVNLSNSSLSASALGIHTAAGIYLLSPQESHFENLDVDVEHRWIGYGIWFDATHTFELGHVLFDTLTLNINTTQTPGQTSQGVRYEARDGNLTVAPGMTLQKSYVRTGNAINSEALYLKSFGDSVLIENSVLESKGQGQLGSGIIGSTVSILGGQDIQFRHNTIVQSAQTDTTTVMVAIEGEVVTGATISAAQPIFTNNLFVARGPAQSTNGIYEYDAFADPKSLHNNVWIGLDTVYRGGDGEGTFNAASLDSSIGPTCRIQQSFGPCTSGQQTVTVSSNFEIVLPDLNELFVDYDGPDNDPTTLGDNDWRLLPKSALTPTLQMIADGGVDTSQNICGTQESQLSGGDVTEDLDGTPRDPSPSIGAFESL